MVIRVGHNELLNEIEGIVKKTLNEAFDPANPNNQIELVDDPKVRSGDEWAQKGGNFPVKRNGKIYYVSRSVAVSLCAMCLDENGNWCVLANQRGPGAGSRIGMWNIPCGFLDYGETAEEGAKRETFEETGVIIPKGTHLRHLGTNTRRLSGSQNISMSFTCVLKGTTSDYPLSADHCEPGEVSDIKWIPVMNNVGKPLKDCWMYKWDRNPKEIYLRARTALIPYLNLNFDREGIVRELKRQISGNPSAMHLLNKLLETIPEETQTATP